MKSRKIFFPLLGIACTGLFLQACKPDMKNKPVNNLSYPDTKKEDVKDVYFGTEIADPYRWLEIDTAQDVGEWVKRQNDFTYSFLNQIPYRDSLKNRLSKLMDYEKFSAPFKEGDYLYFFKNDGLQNQSVLYRQKGENGTPEVFMDPNKLSKDGTVSLSGMSFTEDGSLFAYSLSKGGADWQEIHVMRTADRSETKDIIPDVKFSGMSWKGNEGFFYSKYDDASGSKLSSKTENHKLYYHTLGTPVSADKLVFGNDNDPKRYVGASVSKEGDWLVISTAMATSGNELYLLNLKNKDAKLQTLVSGFESDYEAAQIENGKMFLVTNNGAPNRKLMLVDLENPAKANWKEIIPETENVLSVSFGSGKLFASYLKDAITKVYQYDYSGKMESEVKLPGVGTAGGFDGKETEEKLYFVFTSYITPTSIYTYVPKTGEVVLYKKPEIDFNSDDYTSEQVFYTSKDGTRVPMIITYKKGLEKNGKNPTMLYGYGGFNISLSPSFSTSLIVLLEQGGVYAVPNIRGGGEYGEKWHLAGTKMSKQNVFDDFIAAAEYLIANKYTSSDYLAVSGGSNGGLLVGAILTQRPDLIKVAFPAVGVLDMLRYHKFTAGAGWATDYGTSEDNKEMFQYLLGYSPLHNVKPGTSYPATMIFTGDHDDRVVPAHSFKFGAALQQAQSGPAPVLIRIDINAGHGAGKPTAMVIDEQADKFAFMLWNMGITSLK